MNLSDEFIYALKQLDGFDKGNIIRAIELANHDVVETVADLFDFINFNIEENRFSGITKPFNVEIIKKAVGKAIREKDNIVHYLNTADGWFPKELPEEKKGKASLLKYKGNLEILYRKSVLITGSHEVTNNANMASEYIGKVLASNGYNILSSFSSECEQNAIIGCAEAEGVSTFFLSHDIEHLKKDEKDIIQNNFELVRTLIMSADDTILPTNRSVDNAYLYVTALADCMIIPQISESDYFMGFVEKYLKSDKPVFLVKYKTRSNKEYNCIKKLESLGVMYMSSNSILKQITDTIGEAKDIG